MDFKIEKEASNYVYKRFPNASVLEKEKVITDWTNKIKDSDELVKNFTERVGDPKGKLILDAGCGNGGVSIAFSKVGARVFGVEIEKDLYEISKKHAEALGVKPQFYLYDGLKLPFEDNFFDFAVSLSVLEHTDDPVFYLNEILRVTKGGGFLYLGFPNKMWPRETHTQLLFLTYLPKAFRPIYIKLFNRNPLKDNNLHFYDYFDLKKMIKTGDKYGWSILNEQGKSKGFFKKFIKKVLEFMGLPYKQFLKHILVILKKEKI